VLSNRRSRGGRGGRGDTNFSRVTSLRQALRAAAAIPVSDDAITDCLDYSAPADARFDRALRLGLASLSPGERRGLNRVTGEVAESVAELLLADVGLSVFWHITTPGFHGVDLLFLCSDESVLALEVKGTLRAGTIPRVTPSRLRQMSREWLNGPDNPAMAEWELEADDLYAGVMIIDFAASAARVALSDDFDSYWPLLDLAELTNMAAVLSEAPETR
jgi:hypothetical protein